MFVCTKNLQQVEFFRNFNLKVIERRAGAGAKMLGAIANLHARPCRRPLLLFCWLCIANLCKRGHFLGQLEQNGPHVEPGTLRL